MKHLATILFIALILVSCQSSDVERNSNVREGVDPVRDSIVKSVIQQHALRLPEPLDFSQLEVNQRLDFTSGGLPREDTEGYCGDLNSGFYGRYNLIDRMSDIEPPLVGTIDIYQPGKMSDWRFTDTTQFLQKITLKSDVISVWDSIHVGLLLREACAFKRVASFIPVNSITFRSYIILEMTP